MLEINKAREQQLKERIKRLESYVYEGDDTPQLKKIYEDQIKFLREELKQYEQIKGGYMLEILEFIFKDFWHFIGVIILLAIISDGVSGMFK